MKRLYPSTIKLIVLMIAVCAIGVNNSIAFDTFIPCFEEVAIGVMYNDPHKLDHLSKESFDLI